MLKRIIFIIVLFFHSNAFAVLGGIGFWQQKKASLSFSTSAQVLSTYLCSGIATVQYKDVSGAVANVASNTTVNLSTSNSITFYSDSSCTTPITSVVISSGTSSASFYFSASSAGSLTYTADATNISGATQGATLSANSFVWTGGGANVNWATAGNWSGGVAPGTSDIAIFTTCASNCSPTINASISVKGVRVLSGYSGTITQNASMTLGSSGWVQVAGTFTGGSQSIALNGPYLNNGGVFTSTSGTISLASNWTQGSSGTFAHNSGTISASGNIVISPGVASYNNLTISGSSYTMSLNGEDMIVAGTLTLSTSSWPNGIFLNSGRLLAGGNIVLTSGGIVGGSATIKVTGKASGQTISSTSGATIPSLTIEAGTNPVTLTGTLIFLSDYIVNSVGTLTTTGSTLIFDKAASIIPGSAHYNNVTFNSGNGGHTLTLNSNTLYVDGTLHMNGGTWPNQSTFNNGTIELAGDLTLGTGGMFGDISIILTGNPSGQTIAGSGNAYSPNLIINAGTNPVTLTGTLLLASNLTITSVGTFTSTGSTLYLNQISTLTLGSVHFYNVIFSNSNGFTTNLNGGVLNVDGALTLDGNFWPNTSYVTNGTIAAYGNISATSGGMGGSAQLQILGSADQTITAAGSAVFPSGNVTVNTTAGAKLVLASAISWNNTSQALTVTSGGVNMAGYALTAKSLSLNSTTVTKNGGTLTVNGSAVGTGTLYGGTIDP